MQALLSYLSHQCRYSIRMSLHGDMHGPAHYPLKLSEEQWMFSWIRILYHSCTEEKTCEGAGGVGGSLATHSADQTLWPRPQGQPFLPPGSSKKADFCNSFCTFTVLSLCISFPTITSRKFLKHLSTFFRSPWYITQGVFYWGSLCLPNLSLVIHSKIFHLSLKLNTSWKLTLKLNSVWQTFLTFCFTLKPCLYSRKKKKKTTSLLLWLLHCWVDKASLPPSFMSRV